MKLFHIVVEKLIRENCKIDNEDQIIYKGSVDGEVPICSTMFRLDFVQNIRKKLTSLNKT